MSTTPADIAAPVEDTEAFAALMDRLGRKETAIPRELLVRHIMAVVPAHEWPVRIEALDALLRRLDSARKDELRVETRPENGHVLGAYSTRRKGSGARPYQAVIRGVDPIEARCDCPDYLRNSLAQCKHTLAVLEFLHARPSLIRKALREQERRTSTRGGPAWDPIRPLLGPGDWLDRVTWTDVEGASPAGARAAQARALFQNGSSGALALKSTHRGDPARRLEVVKTLLAALPVKARSLHHDPALRAMLLHERERLKRIVETTLWRGEIRTAIRRLKVPLYPYQREGVKRFLETGRLLLADDMGLGKTAQAIACCDILLRAGRVRRGMVIAPASLKPQWAREWAHFSDLPITVVDGPPSEREQLYATMNEGFVIINYEQLLRDLELVRGWDPDMVVLDEAQRIKNWATKTALSVKGLNPPYRLVLTGTPMENRVEELASIVEWVDDMALEPKWRLPALHSLRADGRREVIGVRHLDTLRERLRPGMVRRVRQEVLDQLPPRIDVRVPIEMTPEQIEQHEALNQPIAKLMAMAEKRPLTQVEFLRLMTYLTLQRIISNGLAQLQFESVWPGIKGCPPDESMIRGLSAPKLLELRQLVRQLVIDQGRKVVVFSQWRRMLSLAHWAVGDILGEQDLRAGFFTGAENQKRRTQNIVEFHDDPAFRILFLSDAGGVGLNLQRAANSVINVELPWNPAVLEQRIGRIYRIGQEQPIDVYNLVCEAGIESRIADLVGNKQAFFKGLFDGASDSVQFEQAGSFLSRVKKLYDPAALAEAAEVESTEAIELDDLADSQLDDEVADPYAELIEAGDESQDVARPEPEPGTEPLPQLATTEVRRAALPGMEEVRGLFAQLQVRKGEDGRILIEAPPEAASTLGALFEGMAALLQAAGRQED